MASLERRQFGWRDWGYSSDVNSYGKTIPLELVGGRALAAVLFHSICLGVPGKAVSITRKSPQKVLHRPARKTYGEFLHVDGIQKGLNGVSRLKTLGTHFGDMKRRIECVLLCTCRVPS